MELVKAGVLPDPELGLGAAAFRPYEGYEWLYTKTFDAPALAAGERAVLDFETIDQVAWIVSDGWPIVSDAVVDYYGGKKRAYATIRNVQRDQLVCVTDDGVVHAVNDTLRAVKGRVKVTDRVSGRVLLEKAYDVPANAAVALGRVGWSGQGVLDIAYEQGGETLSNWFLYGEIPFRLDQVESWLK